MSRRKKKNINVRLFFFVLISIFLVFLYTTYGNEVSNSIKVSPSPLEGLKVSFLDVGQADSILIQFNEESMLIDAGNNNDGENIVKYLKNQNIEKFKYVVGTHAHEDHIGGIDNVILNFDVEHFYMPNVLTTTKTFEDVLDALNTKNVIFETPNINDELSLGDAKITVLYVNDDSSNLNNTSIVLKLVYKDISFLFMGDAESDVEPKILNADLKSNILKVGHHGSSTSSSDKFISKVNPDYAIISVGKNNSYNHPTKKVLNTLNKYEIKTLRTDELGTIIFTSDGTSVNYENISTNIDGGN